MFLNISARRVAEIGKIIAFLDNLSDRPCHLRIDPEPELILDRLCWCLCVRCPVLVSSRDLGRPYALARRGLGIGHHGH